MPYACYSIFTQCEIYYIVKALCVLFIVRSQDTVQTQCEDTSSVMTAHILGSCMIDIQNCGCRGNPSCWMWFVFFLFHLRLEFYALSAGVFPVCEWNIKHQPHIFFTLSEEIFRKSAGPPACQKPPVYQGICSAVSYSSLAMADILACIFGYQVNINCKGTNKPVPYACLILFHLIPVSLTDLVYCYVSPEKTQQDCLPSVVWLIREQMEGVSPISQSPLQTQISIPAQPITTTVPVRDFIGSRSLSLKATVLSWSSCSQRQCTWAVDYWIYHRPTLRQQYLAINRSFSSHF